jgi:5-formyltetrahydrofolate cyclo-ligase
VGAVISLSKSEIREAFKKIRNKISEDEARKEGEKALYFFRSFIRDHEHWLLYSPIQNEISTAPLFAALKSHGKKIYFPRCEGEKLFFHQVNEWDELQNGKFGLEPSKDLPLFASKSEKHAAIVIPGIAFSRLGHRIGFGRGFYDRFLAEHPNLLRFGFGYNFQLALNEWESLPTDQVLHYIVCPNGLWGAG